VDVWLWLQISHIELMKTLPEQKHLPPKRSRRYFRTRFCSLTEYRIL